MTMLYRVRVGIKRLSVFEAKRCAAGVGAGCGEFTSRPACTLRFPRREPVACFARLGRSNGKQWRAIFSHFCWLRASRRARRTEYAMRSWPAHPFGPRRTRRTLSVLVESVTPPSLRAVVRMRLPSALYGTTAHCTSVVRADAALGELDGVEDSVARHSNFAVSTCA